ncbi:hypothetical protein [Loigolactobacillus backii]|uniref:hypothetical protein n=1 Tax=Loigolactobacillus backii TaxID=375175 RepID=UPI0022FD422D|nr:hypothetical protein [Loigolactobacillus backii]MDA5386508.1 hypothetical protein [Loigolactobacillus backii]MDA5389035.1 hypothetical protein [Loigolactobacillus backii]
MKYRYKQLFKAEQFDGSDKMRKKYFINRHREVNSYIDNITDRNEINVAGPWQYALKTQKGEKQLSIGDWILIDKNGLFSSATDEFFKENYEPVE